MALSPRCPEGCLTQSQTGGGNEAAMLRFLCRRLWAVPPRSPQALPRRQTRAEPLRPASLRVTHLHKYSERAGDVGLIAESHLTAQASHVEGQRRLVVTLVRVQRGEPTSAEDMSQVSPTSEPGPARTEAAPTPPDFVHGQGCLG